MLHHFVQQVADSRPVLGGDAERLPQPERVKIVQLFGDVTVQLVDGENDGFPRFAELIGHVFIRAGEAALRVGKKDDDVRRFDRRLRLRLDMPPHFVLRAEFQPPGIHQRKIMPAPLGVRIETVARDARPILHDGKAPAGHFIEKCRFPDVRSSDDRHDRFCHFRIFPCFRLPRKKKPLGASGSVS